MRRFGNILLLGAYGLGCADLASNDEGADCGYVEREVSLDAKFGEETPREVIALLERPVEGPVTWYPGEREYIDVEGVSGESQFHAQVIADSTVWVREGDEAKGGIHESRLSCGSFLFFDATVMFTTADGGLAEVWNGKAEYLLSGTLGGHGSIAVIVEDPPPFAGSLTVTEHPEVVEQWEEHELRVALAFVTNPLDFVGMTGSVRYHLWTLGDGEGAGMTATIAEFALPP